MQPATSASAWPKRILITGVVLTLVGLASFVMMMGSLEDYYDPREASEHTAQNGEVNTMTLKSGCWVVNVEDSAKDYTISYQFLENGVVSGDVDEGCKTDFQPQVSGVDFATVTKLDIDEKSEVLVTISCESQDGCENPVYFTNGDDVMADMITDPGILITGGLCFIGFIFIPLGWLLIAINRGHANKVQITQNQIVNTMNPIEDDLVPDREILTTDQLYQLVRGEIPDHKEPVNDVPNPFADANTMRRKPVVAKEGGSINKASSFTHENPPTDDSWKNWDDA